MFTANIFMSEPMDLTPPTNGHMYVHPSWTFTIPEPGIPPQPSYLAILPQPSHPVVPPQVSSSVPPYLHLASHHFQPLHSPPIISPPVSLPNVNMDNAFYVNPHEHQVFAIPHIYHLSPTASLYQPAPCSSPDLSLLSYQPIIPSSIPMPVPWAPIPDLDQSFHNHSHT